MVPDNSNELERLLQIAEGKGDPHKKERPTDVDRYIKKFKIQAGDTKVPARLVYHHYRKWRKQNFMSRKHFFQHFNKIFDKCMYQKAIHYYLDPEPYDLSLEAKVRANTFLRKERDAKRKRKEKILKEKNKKG